jgi:Zn-dependent protease
LDIAFLTSGFIYYIVFLFSTTLHEAAHAWSAKRLGDLTAYQGGQVSLNPEPHIRREPVGMVLLPIISTLISGWPFGYASAPYDPDWATRYPKRAAWMALAGPASNLALVLISFAIIRLGAVTGVFYPPDSAAFGQIVGVDQSGFWPGVAYIIGVVLSMNLMLACLNVLPLPPLDGSAAVMIFMNHSAAVRYQQVLWQNPMLGTVGMVMAWQMFDVVFHPIFWFVVNLLYPGANYT